MSYNNSEDEMLLNLKFDNLIFTKKNDQFIATLIDNQKYEIIKGYGATALEAINDLYHCLI